MSPPTPAGRCPTRQRPAPANMATAGADGRANAHGVVWPENEGPSTRTAVRCGGWLAGWAAVTVAAAVAAVFACVPQRGTVALDTPGGAGWPDPRSATGTGRAGDPQPLDPTNPNPIVVGVWSWCGDHAPPGGRCRRHRGGRRATGRPSTAAPAERPTP